MRQYLDDVGLANNAIAMVEMKFMVSNAVKLLLNYELAILVNDKSKIVDRRKIRNSLKYKN